MTNAFLFKTVIGTAIKAVQMDPDPDRPRRSRLVELELDGQD